MSISTQVRQCLAKFKDLEDRNLQRADLEDEHGRFRIWAGNVSAHRSGGRRSLEYRLRDSSNLQSMVSALLQDLLQALGDLQRILEDGPKGVSHDKYDASRAGQPSPNEDSDDEDDAALFGTEHDGDIPHDAVTSTIYEIREINLCLLRFSMTLRNPARHDQMKDSASTSTQHFERYDVDHVRDKFPSAEATLHVRLGRGISKHRQYFKYREEHHSKLAEGLDDGEVKHERPSTIATSLNVPAPETQTPQGDELETESLYTATSYAPTTAGDSPLRPPPLPEAGQDGSPFECPLCYDIIVAEDERAWRQHLYEDLPPYICTQPECITANQRYSRRRDWQRHQASAHNRYWICPFGCSARFDSEGTFQKHLIKKHGGDAVTHQRLLETCAVASNDASDLSCPLCQKQLSSSKLWMKHLGHHLEQLALHAIPKHVFTQDSDDEEHDDTDQSARSSVSSAFNDGGDPGLSLILEGLRGRGEDTDGGIIRCICGFKDDDGYTVGCDKCQTWQHVDCYYPQYVNGSLPEELQHLCLNCNPRAIDIQDAISRQEVSRSIWERGQPKKWHSELGQRRSSLGQSESGSMVEETASDGEYSQSSQGEHNSQTESKVQTDKMHIPDTQEEQILEDQQQPQSEIEGGGGSSRSLNSITPGFRPCPVRSCKNTYSISDLSSLKRHLATHGSIAGTASEITEFRIPKSIVTRKALVRCGLTVYEDHEFYFMASAVTTTEESAAQRRLAGVMEIEEACDHEVQIGGVCANCGMDMAKHNTDVTRLGETTVEEQRQTQPEHQSGKSDSEDAGAMQQLHDIERILAKWKADCQPFLQDPSTRDLAETEFTHLNLSERGLREVLLPLDQVDTIGDNEARALRKGLVAECQGVMSQLDKIYNSVLETVGQNPSTELSTQDRQAVVDGPPPNNFDAMAADLTVSEENQASSRMGEQSAASNTYAPDPDIPPGAKWTKIDRKLVSSEALEEAGERFEERLDCMIVLRPLSKEEIQTLADRTREIREAKDWDEFLPQKKVEEDEVVARKRQAEKDIEEAMKHRLREAGYTDEQIEHLIETTEEDDATSPRTEHRSSDAFRPTYTKIHVKYISTETLRYYDLPWEHDKDDSNYIIIKRELSSGDSDILFEHTRRLRAGDPPIRPDSDDRAPGPFYSVNSEELEDMIPNIGGDSQTEKAELYHIAEELERLKKLQHIERDESDAQRQ